MHQASLILNKPLAGILKAKYTSTNNSPVYMPELSPRFSKAFDNNTKAKFKQVSKVEGVLVSIKNPKPKSPDQKNKPSSSKANSPAYSLSIRNMEQS